MARINIEDSLFKDNRFYELIALVGSKAHALGLIVEAWIVAQKYWKVHDHGIPKDAWQQQRLDARLIESGLALDRGEYIYVCGSKNQFAWLVQKIEAGRKGGLSGRYLYKNMTNDDRAIRAKARKKIANAIQRGRLQKPKHCENCGREALIEAHHSDYSKPFDVIWTCKKCHHEIHDALIKDDAVESVTSVTRVSEAGAKQPLAGAKPPFSVLYSPTPTQKELKTAEKSAVPSSRFIGVYIKAYQARYGAKARPSLEGKTLGGIKRLLGGIPLERACALIQAYLQIDDPWFKTKAHDFETFAQNLTKIGLALDTGARPEGSRRGIEEILDKEFSRGDGRIQHTDK